MQVHHYQPVAFTQIDASRWSWDEIEAQMALPEMRLVAPFMKAQWQSLAVMRAPLADAAAAGAEARMQFVAELHAAGAPIVLGTDMGNPFVVPGHSIHQELALLGVDLPELAPLVLVPSDALDQAEALGGQLRRRRH